MIKTIVGSFDSVDEADRGARELRQSGFMNEDINVLVNNVRRTEHDASTGDTAAGAATTGALAGGAVGGVAGIAASMAGLAVPGIGPILAAGPIVAALAGAGAGAVAGGLIGALTEAGVARTRPNCMSSPYVAVARSCTCVPTNRALRKLLGVFDVPA